MGQLEPYVLIVMIIGAVLILALVIAVIILAIRNRKSLEKADKVKIKNGVRYSVEDNIKEDDGSVNVSYREKDFDLIQGQTYTAKKGGKLMPGKYTVLSASESTEKFNIRIGNYVREYSHGDGIVISEGDEITSVSHSLVLR